MGGTAERGELAAGLVVGTLRVVEGALVCFVGMLPVVIMAFDAAGLGGGKLPAKLRMGGVTGGAVKEEAAVGVEPMPLADMSRVIEGERAADDDGGGSVLPFCGRGVK